MRTTRFANGAVFGEGGGTAGCTGCDPDVETVREGAVVEVVGGEGGGDGHLGEVLVAGILDVGGGVCFLRFYEFALETLWGVSFGKHKTETGGTSGMNG